MDYAHGEVVMVSESTKAESPEGHFHDLYELQLALVGGGIGNTII
jgi:hypothetical protein